MKNKSFVDIKNIDHIKLILFLEIVKIKERYIYIYKSKSFTMV